jgi:hypothetical protein
MKTSFSSTETLLLLPDVDRFGKPGNTKTHLAGLARG